jgi:hypothetical protein
VYAGAILLASSYGIVAVCVATVTVHVLMVLSLQRFLLGPVLQIRMSELWSDLAPAILSLPALFAAALSARQLLEQVHPGAIPTLALLSAAGGTGYLLALSRLFPTAWADLKLIAGRVLLDGKIDATDRTSRRSPASRTAHGVMALGRSAETLRGAEPRRAHGSVHRRDEAEVGIRGRGKAGSPT